MNQPHPPVDRRPRPLRERKKLRTRRALADAALDLFSERGFAAVTLDELVDSVEVSKRTFFRYFPSKEDVAIEAERELWDACIAGFTRTPVRGPVLPALRDALTGAVCGMSEDWEVRFLRTRRLISRTPALWNHSLLLSWRLQERLTEELERKLGVDGREDVRLRLAGEFALGAYRVGARNWTAGRGTGARGRGGRTALARRVAEAFDAAPAALRLSAG